jgi:ribosomal protein L9
VNIANNLKHLNKSQTKLNDVLETLFTKDGGINQSLSDVELSSIIAKTRDTVINLYLSCEEHYGRGVAIYEAISNKKILKTLLNQQKELVKHRIRLSVGF